MNSKKYNFGSHSNFLNDDLRSFSSMSDLGTDRSKQSHNKQRSGHLTLSNGRIPKGASSNTSTTGDSLRAMSTSYLLASSRTYTQSQSDLSDFSDESENIGDIMPRLSLNEPSTSGPPVKPKKKYKNGTRHSMSFSNEKYREIERVNNILLKRIMDQKKSVKKPATKSTNKPVAMSLSKVQQQREIDLQNALLDKKIRQAGAQTKTRF